jgi:hypothetical protein
MAGCRLLLLSRMRSFCWSTPFSCAAQTEDATARTKIANKSFIVNPFALSLPSVLKQGDAASIKQGSVEFKTLCPRPRSLMQF